MKFFTGLAAILFAAMLTFISPQTANAQFHNTYSSNIFLNSELNNLFNKRWAVARARSEGRTKLAEAMEGGRSNGANASTQQTAAQPDILRRVPLSNSSFKNSRSPIMPEALARSIAGDQPETAVSLKGIFIELLKNYSQMLVDQKESRLQNNVAGSATFALLTSRMVLTGGEELSEKQTEAVLQDINALLASSDKFKALSAAERQKIHETFIIVAGLSAMLNEEGTRTGNAETVAQGKDLAKTILSQFFDRPIEQVRFTENGVSFVD